MSREVNKFVLEGEEIEFTDSKAREDINDLDTKVDNNYNTLDTKIDNNYNTLDNKIDSEATRLDGRVDTVNDRVTSEATRLDGKINTQGVPAGGTTSQILAKTSNNNYATQWVNPPTPGPGGSDIDDSVIALDKTWSSNKINAEDNIISGFFSTQQNDLIANKNYKKGEIFSYNDFYYYVDSIVNQGESFVEGTNCTKLITPVAATPINGLLSRFTKSTFEYHNFNNSETFIVQLQSYIRGDTEKRGRLFMCYNIQSVTPTDFPQDIAGASCFICGLYAQNYNSCIALVTNTSSNIAYLYCYSENLFTRWIKLSN